MTYLSVSLSFLLFISGIFADELSINYQLLDRAEFEKVVVGNTVVGITLHSHSLYMLYFLPEGICELWKQNNVYAGKWWIERDSQDRDFVRAFWPSYASSEPRSLFSPHNPNYGQATAIRYYRNTQNGSIFIAGTRFQASALLVPGCAFPIDR